MVKKSRIYLIKTSKEKKYSIAEIKCETKRLA